MVFFVYLLHVAEFHHIDNSTHLLLYAALSLTSKNACQQHNTSFPLSILVILWVLYSDCELMQFCLGSIRWREKE